MPRITLAAKLQARELRQPIQDDAIELVDAILACGEYCLIDCPDAYPTPCATIIEIASDGAAWVLRGGTVRASRSGWITKIGARQAARLRAGLPAFVPYRERAESVALDRALAARAAALAAGASLAEAKDAARRALVA